MGEQLFLERFVWFDNETRLGHYPNAFKLAARFEISTKTAQRSIDYFRDRLQAPLTYLITRKGYQYSDSSYQLPATRISEAELLALLISRKMITEASGGSLAGDTARQSGPPGCRLQQNLLFGVNESRQFGNGGCLQRGAHAALPPNGSMQRDRSRPTTSESFWSFAGRVHLAGKHDDRRSAAAVTCGC